MMLILPKIRGYVCVTAHPSGCAANVHEQIDYVRKNGALSTNLKNVLIIGSSTGYGLSSRIVSTFACGANTLGVFYERPGEEDRPATAGWYNTAAFTQEATKAGIKALNLNGDAFTHLAKEKAIALIKAEMGPIDLIVYSLASPRRTDPNTGETYRSVLKPIGKPFSAKNLDTDRACVEDVHIAAAEEADIIATKKVMGGEDWELWIKALASAGLLAKGVKTVAYDYIGPEITWPVYHQGTIGMAKEHLKSTCDSLDSFLRKHCEGNAYISVNKALVTQASSAIPVVPLYISILFKIMKEKGIHEGCIEQIDRLFRTHLFSAKGPSFDADGKIRVDDWELRADVQAAVNELWPIVSTENISTLTDFDGYRNDFLRLFGFNMEGIDYKQRSEPIQAIDPCTHVA
jgi:enoyl-[acyl-carrier protein] reductase/trans-2-enoyl-CoA reductase (NAD+)